MASSRIMLIQILIIVDLSVVTVFPSLIAVGSWEEVLFFSMDFTVSQDILEFVLQDANFYLKKLVFAFLTACVYRFLTSLKSCISFLFDANAVRHRMFLCWSRAVRSGVNQGLYLFLVLHFLNGACLFKMVRKALLKNNQASSTDGMRSISFQDNLARLNRKACSLKGIRECLTVMVISVIAEFLFEDNRGVFGGQVSQDDIYKGAVFTDLELYLVGSMIIWVRLRASSSDCRTVGVLSISQFRLPNRTSSEDRHHNSHMVSKEQLGAYFIL